MRGKCDIMCCNVTHVIGYDIRPACQCVSAKSLRGMTGFEPERKLSVLDYGQKNLTSYFAMN